MKKPLYMMYYIVLLIACLIGGLYGVASAQSVLHRLTVEKSGAGSGTVTSSPAGIKCGGQCFYDFGEGKNVNLTAKADVGSKFISWSGACSGTKGCSIAVSTDITATALFTSESNISISPVSKEFGNVKPGTTKTGQFKVTNKGSLPLNVTGVNMSGADAAEFTVKTDTCSTKQVKPSASCVIKVAFNPPVNTSGLAKTATMTITSTDPDTPSLDVPLTGRSVPKITVTPAFKNFGVVAPGRSKSAVFKVFNKGTLAMDVGSVTFDGLDVGEFGKGTDTCSGKSDLQPNQFCTVSITFTPTSTGLKTAQINIPSDDHDTGTLTVALAGGAKGQVPTRAWERLSAFGSNFGISSEIVVDGGGKPAIAYADNANPYQLYAKSYSGGSWNLLGTSISTAASGYPSLAVNEAGTLYVGYQEGALGAKASVKSYSGTDWALAGTDGFSSTIVHGTAVFLKGDTPYLAFVDNVSNDNDHLTVMWNKDNGGWTNFGDPRFSDRIINGVFAFTVLPDGKPCVAAYEADATYRYLYVYRYDDPSGTGSLWHKIGDSGLNVPVVTDSGLMSPHLASDNAGGLYVSYTTQVANPPRNVVKKYNAVTNTWDGLSGPEGYVDDGNSLFNGLFGDGKDLYVAYIDESVADSYRITVKKFDRPSKKWVLYAGKLPYVLPATQAIQGVSLFMKDGAAYVAVTVYDAVASAYTSAVVKGR